MKKEPIGKYVAAIYRNMQSIINFKLADIDIKSGQQDFLFVISKNEGISQKELSNSLYVGKSTTAKAVKNLIDNGYVTREQDVTDKRYNRLYLTEKGKEIAPRMNATYSEIMDISTRDLLGDEFEQTLILLKKILKSFSDEKSKITSIVD